jgi:hypothetical protein
MQILDVHDPFNPKLLEKLEITGNAYSINLSDDENILIFSNGPNL